MIPSKSAVQQCPICRAQQPLEATRCGQCGATLNGVPVAAAQGAAHRKTRSKTPLEGPVVARWDEGETDLYEGSLPSLSLQGLLVIVVTLAILGGGGIFAATRLVERSRPTPTEEPTLTATTDGRSAAASQATIPPTNTKLAVPPPTLALATVTPAPPTPSITLTKGPCRQKVKPGDTVYGLASRCGHKDLAIVEKILELNNMKDAAQLQIGQTLEIPWPTPTGGPQNQPDNTPGTPGADVALNTEPTLLPGVGWYTVKKGDTASSIVFKFNTNIKTLRDLNPEIQFLQCDFGLPTGGPACTLRPVLGEGQRVRIPAPPPTPSLPPTLTGSETATATPTATFNAPFSQSPDDNMLFMNTELPTLRWVASGQLGPSEVYLVTVRNRDTNTTYQATTRELALQLPAEWQPIDGKRHVFEWLVAVASVGDNKTPVPSSFTTETRTFTWQGRQENK